MTSRPFTNAPPLSAPSVFATSAITFTERLAGSSAGLMNITLPVKARPGTVSVVNSRGCPTRTADARDAGTATVRSSRRLSTMRNIAALPPMFSTRSPTLTPRMATIPSMGALMNDLASRAWAVRTCARAAADAASAASTAVFASSKFCGVISPNSLSCWARSNSRFARDSAVRAWASAALSASMPASVSAVSSRASRWPRRTDTHSVT